MVTATPPADTMDEDDPFSLDFTNLTSEPEPAPTLPPPVVPAPAAASPAPAAPPPVKPAAATASKPAPAAVPKPAPASPPVAAKPAAPAAKAVAPAAKATAPAAKPTAPAAKPAAPAAKLAAAAAPKPTASKPLALEPMEKPPLDTLEFDMSLPMATAAPTAPPRPSSFGQQAAAKAAPATPAAPVKPDAPARSAGQILLETVARQHAAGQSAEASTQLEAALRAGKLGDATEAGWSMLFDLLQVLNRRTAFETLADAYAKRFEKSAPAWLEPSAATDGLETGGAASVALSGTLSAASEGALKKLFAVSESNPMVRLGLTKVTDADNDGCRLLLDTLRQFKKKKRECLIGGAEEFSSLLASKIEMMRREREETWLLLLELYQQAGKQEVFDDIAVGYAVTFEVSPPSWETLPAAKAGAADTASAQKRATRDPFLLEGELLIGSGGVAAITTAAKGKDAITLEMERLIRIDEPSAQALLADLSPLVKNGLHVRIRGASVLVATLLGMVGVDKIATIEIRRR